MVRKPIHLTLLVVAVVAVVAARGADARDREEAVPKPTLPGLELWDDPEFRKEFLGSYGVNAEIEPRVTLVERETMEKVLPMLGTDPDAALAALEEATTPESSAVFDFTIGNLHFQRGQLAPAAARYETALEKFPSFRRAHKNLGIIRFREGDHAAAVKSLSRVIELGGGDSTVYGLLGYAYAALDQHLAAESAFRSAMLLDPGTVDWKLGLTMSVLKQQRYGEAVSLCDELIAKSPDRADYWLLQANAFIGLGQPLRAAQNFEIVDRMGRATVQALNTLGDIYVNEGMWDLAARAYRRALEKDPGQAVARPLRNVEILAQRGALEQANGLVADVKRVAGDRLDAADRKKLLKLEARVAVAEGAGDEAAAVLEEIVALDPLDGEALLLLGQHYARIEQNEKALFYFERAQSLEGFEADARVRHAQLLVSQARYGEAVPLLKRAQEIKPREDVARYLEQVERAARAAR